MKLVCPGCGAIASAESWTNDADCRETLLIITRLPSPLPKTTLGYLSLFRPGTRALGWKKALRLAREIEELVGKGYVHVQGRVDRNCSATIWARAMEQMVEQRNGLSLPMPNHIYLSKVAWDLAEKADYQGEKKQHSTASTRTPRPDRSVADLSRESPGRDPLLDPMEKARRKWDEEHGTPTGVPGLNDLSSVVQGMD